MPVWFVTRGRRAEKPAASGQPGAAHVLTAAVLGFALLGGQYRSSDRSAVAGALDVQGEVLSVSREHTTVASKECLPDGGGSLKVELSGELEHNIEWHDDDMECGGHGSNAWVVVAGESTKVPFQNLQFGGVPAGAGSPVDLKFDIRVAEGATGTNLPARVQVYDEASSRNFATSEWGGCTATVTEQSLIDENPAFRQYRLAANGSCTEPLRGPGAGGGLAEVTIGPFEFVGRAVWQGPPM